MPKKPKIPKALLNDPNFIKNPVTKNQKLWNVEYIRLKNRVKKWEKKYRAIFTDIPNKPQSRIEKKDIERLKAIAWKKLTEEEKQRAKREWQYRYDEGEIHPQLNEEAIDSEEEIEEWVEDMIEEIASTEGNGYTTPDPTIELELRGLLESARNRMGDKQFKNFLEDHAGELQAEVRNAKSGSPGKPNRQGYSSYTGRSQDQQNSIARFATILNFGIPLSQEQSYTLQTEGYVQFDYGELL